MPAPKTVDALCPELWTKEIIKSFKQRYMPTDEGVETLAGVYWEILQDPKIKCHAGCTPNHHHADCVKLAASNAVVELEKRAWHIGVGGTASSGPK